MSDKDNKPHYEGNSVCNLPDEVLLETIEELQRRGTDLSIYVPGRGQSTLTGPELLLYLKDKDLFFSQHHGVLKSDYYRWLEFSENPQCMAKTKSGKRCRHQVHDVRVPFLTPQEYLKNYPFFCPYHENRKEDYETL